MFEDLMRDIQSTFTERFLRIQVTAEPEPPRRMAPPPPAATPSGADDLFTGPAPRAAPPRPSAPAVSSSLGRLGNDSSFAANGVGRNDPCPCGSGKKYKKCHGVGK
jgi:preprotein translocase subunit SecA